MTPAMKQFHDVKENYPDHIVLFRMGDFYETFYEDAKIASEILNITLTSRDKEKKVPMAGVPFHALDNYLNKLIEANKKVVIVEQLENPSEAQGVVKRGVVKIMTPGTAVVDENSKQNNYLVAVHVADNEFELAFLDITEGLIYFAKFTDKKDLENNIQILNSKEILIPNSLKLEKIFSKEFLSKNKDFLNQIDEILYENNDIKSEISKEILSYFNKYNSVKALLNYVKQTQKTPLVHINKISKISLSKFMNLDITAIRNLELLEGMRKGATALIDVIDECKTNSGSKKLKNWIIKPLLDKSQIDNRLDSIDSFIKNGDKNIVDLRETLSHIYDLQRITSKIGLSTANARDLRNAVESIKVIFSLVKELKDLNLSESLGEIVEEIEENIFKSQKILSDINIAIKETPPLSIREGGMIKESFNEDLARLHDLKNGGKEWLRNFQTEEIKKTGISTLKVNYNKVFGYYIEISKSHTSKAPDSYIRKQTLVNAERYITAELKEQEANILGADDRIRKLEFEIFSEILSLSKNLIPSLQSIDECIAKIDIFLSLAKIALENNWIRPQISTDDSLSITNGRHPVIEKLLKKEGKIFVANSIFINKDKSLQLITGPNMGGKSTFIRQVAILVLLSQIGSFIPAKKAEIGIVDRIFTRVGASDNLSGGESTFMVEMLETAFILNNATKNSLIILDEVGRGTSTFDGMSLAWAICEYIRKIGAKTLFATHYHELTELANKYENVKNLSVKVIEHNEEIVFIHQIIDGKADRSYGIHVATLAGLPNSVTANAKKILKILEKDKSRLEPKPNDLFNFEEENLRPELHSQDSEINDKIIKTIQNLNPESLTPIEALQYINLWKNELMG